MNRKIFQITLRIAVAMLLASVFSFPFISNRSSAQEQVSVADKTAGIVTLKAEKRGFPLINLQDGRKLETQFVGANDAAQFSASRSLAMTNADLNADGAQDLIVGYADSDGGHLAYYKGSLDTLSARTPEIFEGMKEGRFPAPFQSEPSLIKLPIAPDFIGTGDFNRDGAKDIIVAQRGDNKAYLLVGNGRNSFSISYIDLPGQVTAMLTDNIDPLDNSADAAFAVVGESGASLLVYSDAKDAFGSSPEIYPLPAEATSLAIGQLDRNAPMDIVAAAGNKVAIIHGSYPDNQSDKAAQVEVLNQDADVVAVRVGNFIWDRENRPEIALLDSGGTVHILERGNIDTRMFSDAEWKMRWKVKRDEAMAQEAAHGIKSKKQRQIINAPESWTEADSIQISAPLAAKRASSTSFFTSARMTSFGVEDLLVVDSASRQVHILVSNTDELKSSGNALRLSTTGERAVVSLDVEGTPATVLPMRLNVMNRPGIVMLDEESSQISYAPAAPAATFTVTKTADTYDGACNADCSFREALQAANATVAADLIMVPAGTYTINQALGNPDNDVAVDPAAQQSGDWDVFYDTTIQGAGQATTILQAGTSTANGYDRVLDAIQNGVGIPDLTLSGLTITNGRCRADIPCTDGGGLRYAVDALGVLTISDSTVSNSRTEVNTANPASNGGGIFGGQGKYNFTNLTLSGNVAAFPVDGCTNCGSEGGGIIVTGRDTTNPTSLTMTNCIFTNNQARTATSFGGRGGALASSPDSVSITGGTFTGNTADIDGGAFRLFTGTTISGAIISNNTAKQSGGGIWSDPLANDNTPLTNSFTNLIMKGNVADSNNTIVASGGEVTNGDGGAIYHNRGTLNLSGSTIGGTAAGEPNTAYNGGGVGHSYAQNLSALNNSATLNINGGSIVGNVANNNGGGVLNDATQSSTGGSSVLNIGATTTVTMTDNKAKNNGGAIAVITTGGSPTATGTLTNMTLRNNRANSDNSGGGDGGAFYQNNNATTVGTTFTGTLIIGGTSAGQPNFAVNGAGISNTAGLLVLPANASITGNTATANGGGIFNGGTINSFSGASISNNSAANGGGIANSGTLTMSGGTVNSNTASTTGGGVLVSGGTATFDGTTFSSNSSPTGNDIVLTGGTTNLNNAISITNNIATAGGTLNFNTGTKTIGGNFTFSSGAVNAGSSTVNLAGNFAQTGGTFTAGTSTFNFNGTGNQSISNSGLITFNNLTDSNINNPLAINNSFNVNGTLNVNGANATLSPVSTAVIGGTGILTGTGTVRVTRASGTDDFFTQYAMTTKTLTNLTVDYIGAAAQGISATTYNNLRFNNASGGSLSGNVIVNGTFTRQAGTINIGTNTLTLNSTVSSSGGSFSSAPTGTVIYNQQSNGLSNGQVVLSGNYGNLTFSNFNKDLTNATIGISGTFTPGSGTATTTGSTFTFNGTTAQTIPAFNYNNLTLDNPAGATLSGNVTLPGTLTLTNGTLGVGTNTLTLNGAATATSGTISSAATGTVNYNQAVDGQNVLPGSYGNLTFSNFNKNLTNTSINIAGTFAPGTATGHTTTGSTINFNGTTAQTVPVFNYNNLSVTNAAIKSLGGNLIVAGALTINSGSTLDASASNFALNIRGGFTNNGTFTARSGTVTFDGSAAQTIGGSTATPFFNLTINNAAGVGLGSNATVNGALALQAGNFAVGANTLTLNGAATSSGGTFSSAATGTVNYNQSSNGQAVLSGDYGNLTFSNFNKDLTNASIGVAGAFTTGTATGHITTGSTFNFNGTTPQTIPAFNYFNLTSSSSGARTLSSTGTISIAGAFTPGTNVYTVTGSTLAFVGTSAQTLPAFTYNNLQTNNAAGFTLAGSATVNGNLALVNGVINAGANILTLATTATVSRDPGCTASNSCFVANDANAGGVFKQLSPTTPSSFVFPVGTIGGTDNGYSPVSLSNIVSAAASGLTVRAIDQTSPAVASTAITRYWQLTETGSIQTDLTFTYLPGDAAAISNPSQLRVFRNNTNACTSDCVDEANFTGTAIGVTEFSPWTIAISAPTAAQVRIGGRVVTANNRAVSRAVVAITDQNGQTRTATSNSFGYFRFAEVEAGDYVVNVKHKTYKFNTNVVNALNDTDNLIFVAQP